MTQAPLSPGFALFAGKTYYPAGGWDDLVCGGKSLDDLQALGAKYIEDPWTWFHVVDLSTFTEVASGANEPGQNAADRHG